MWRSPSATAARRRRGVGRPGRPPAAHRPPRRAWSPRATGSPKPGTRRHRRSGRRTLDRGLSALPPPARRGLRGGGLHPPHRLRHRRLSGGDRPGRRGSGRGGAARARAGVGTPQGRAHRDASSRPCEREIVALTLPDLAQVPAVAATLDQLTLAARRADAAGTQLHRPCTAGTGAPEPASGRERRCRNVSSERSGRGCQPPRDRPLTVWTPGSAGAAPGP